VLARYRRNFFAREFFCFFKKGALSRVEIRLGLKKYGFSDSKIEAVFSAADTNQDNMLTIDEFATGIVPLLKDATKVLTLLALLVQKYKY
jgi:hypothetical protein